VKRSVAHDLVLFHLFLPVMVSEKTRNVKMLLVFLFMADYRLTSG
jgi:hypothetical protein